MGNWVAVILLSGLLWPQVLLANGCYIPSQVIPELPSIPVQRAMIIHRGGVETLIVESIFDGRSPEVGWVLPLPAKPTKLAAGDPGMLGSMSMSQRADVYHDLYGALSLALICMPLICFVVAGIIAKREGKNIRGCMWSIAIFTVVLLLIGSVMLPTLGVGGGGAPLPSGVQASSVQRVGSYDVTVLKATTADALSKWLADNSLAQLSAEARAIVNDYISRKWCFAVARLRHDGGKVATPHPIVAQFPSAQPVYPMKLTALAGSKTLVELFVVADRQATAEGFTTAAADRYALRPGDVPEVSKAYASKSQDLIVGHPAAVELMWNGCVVSYLRGELTPEQMKHDVTLSYADLRPQREWAFSPRGRLMLALTIGAVGLDIAILILPLCCRNRFRLTRRGRAVLIGVLGLTLIVAAGAYWLVPVREVRVTKWGSPRLARLMNHLIWRDTCRLAEDEGWFKPGGKLPDWRTLPQRLQERMDWSDARLANPYTGEPIRYERSPGNFTVVRSGDKHDLCFYDIDGVESRYELRVDATTHP